MRSQTHPLRHTRRGGGQLSFSGPFYDYLVEFNLERCTIIRPKIKQQSTLGGIREEYQKPKMDIRIQAEKINKRSQWEPSQGSNFPERVREIGAAKGLP
jgi:hypothetical protein